MSIIFLNTREDDQYLFRSKLKLSLNYLRSNVFFKMFQRTWSIFFERKDHFCLTSPAAIELYRKKVTPEILHSLPVTLPG